MDVNRDRTRARTKLQRLLLACGALSSVLYVATDIAATFRWDGYSYAGQFISELMSIEAPTRPFVVRGFILYSVLATAFGAGIVMSAGPHRNLRVVGWLVVGYAVIGYIGLLFFPMHLRGTVPSMTTTDIMHVVITSIIVLFTFAFVALGAGTGGKYFRRYSIGTIVLLLICGALIARETPRLRALLPTPWLGIEERVTAYASMLWLLVLAIERLRRTSAPLPLATRGTP